MVNTIGCGQYQLVLDWVWSVSVSVSATFSFDALSTENQISVRPVEPMMTGGAVEAST